MTALESLLAQLEEAEASSTPGPWVCENRAHLPWCTPAILTPNRGTLSEMTHYGNMESDCNLLVQCRNNIRKLIEIIRVAREEIALMAEGEGNDARVYQRICQLTLRHLDEIAGGK